MSSARHARPADRTSSAIRLRQPPRVKHRPWRLRNVSEQIPDASVILPTQMQEPSRPDSRERLLLAAILEQAALDTRDHRLAVRQAAWEWLGGEDDAPDLHGFSFRFICRALHLGPEWVLARIRERAAKAPPPDAPVQKRTRRDRYANRRHQ